MTSSENWWRKQWRLTNRLAGARQPGDSAGQRCRRATRNGWRAPCPAWRVPAMEGIAANLCCVPPFSDLGRWPARWPQNVKYFDLRPLRTSASRPCGPACALSYRHCYIFVLSGLAAAGASRSTFMCVLCVKDRWHTTNGLAGARQPRGTQRDVTGARLFRAGAGRDTHGPCRREKAERLNLVVRPSL